MMGHASIYALQMYNSGDGECVCGVEFGTGIQR